jgi:hypothetical protein
MSSPLAAGDLSLSLSGVQERGLLLSNSIFHPVSEVVFVKHTSLLSRKASAALYEVA